MDTVIPVTDYRMPPERVPETIVETLNGSERASLLERVGELLARQNAVVVAHYYTDPDLQVLADQTGGYVSDSLDMARFGYESDATTLVVCGVRFMGETAKILNPEKRVLMPDLQANCSLDIGCPADKFNAFCDQYPDRKVVVYANTSAAVKARADWMVTSGSAVDVVNHLHENGEKLIWAPDMYLGDYVRSKTNADMILWQGSCIVHEEFKGQELYQLKQQYPQAKVLVHPESPASVRQYADVIGSTTAIINACRDLDADTFIIATDMGIFHKIRQAAPGKLLIAAPTAGKSATCKSCAHCPWMAMNTLRKLADVLESGSNEIYVAPEIIERARIPIKRLLEFSASRGQVLFGNNDA